MKLFDSFSLKPWNYRRDGVDTKRRETERQALAVAAQLRLLKGEEERSDCHWRLLKDKAPRKS